MVTRPLLLETLAPLAVLPTSCAAGVPNGSPQGDGTSADTWGNNRAARITPEIMSVSVALIVSITQWVAACDAAAEGITSPIKSGDTLSRGGRGGGQLSGNLPSAAKRVARRSNTSQRALTEHSFGVGGEEKGVLCCAKPARRCCPICPA